MTHHEPCSNKARVSGSKHISSHHHQSTLAHPVPSVSLLLHRLLEGMRVMARLQEGEDKTNHPHAGQLARAEREALIWLDLLN